MCVGNIWAVCARCPTKPADFTLGFLRFPDSFGDRLRQPGIQCHSVPLSATAACAWDGQRMPSTAGLLQAVQGVWKEVGDGTNPRHQSQVSNSLGKARFVPGCQGFLFSMDFAALAWTEIAPKLLLLLHLPGWICQAGLGCAVLSQFHPAFRAGSTGEYRQRHTKGHGLSLSPARIQIWCAEGQFHMSCLGFSFVRDKRAGKCCCWAMGLLCPPPVLSHPQSQFGDPHMRNPAGQDELCSLPFPSKASLAETTARLKHFPAQNRLLAPIGACL